MTFHLILLAAGFGSRFGSNKLVASLDGRPVYRHGFDRLTAIRDGALYPSDVTVVTQYPEIAESVEKDGALAAINEDPARGQTSSLVTAVRALSEAGRLKEDDYLVFFAGDQPFLKRETIERFLGEIAKKKPLLASFASNGRFRNPGAFSTSLAGEILALTGDSGGREILKAHESEVLLFESYEPDELRDIDRPEDLRRFSAGES